MLMSMKKRLLIINMNRIINKTKGRLLTWYSNFINKIRQNILMRLRQFHRQIQCNLMRKCYIDLFWRRRKLRFCKSINKLMRSDWTNLLMKENTKTDWKVIHRFRSLHHLTRSAARMIAMISICLNLKRSQLTKHLFKVKLNCNKIQDRNIWCRNLKIKVKVKDRISIIKKILAWFTSKLLMRTIH